MGRFVGRRWAALVLAVVALAAALSASACVDERSEAETVVAQERPVEAVRQGTGEGASEEGTSAAEPLTLTLSAPEICETTPAQGYSGAAMVWNEETQDWGVKSYKTGYDDVGETAVTWSVGGGTAPYKLVIDGETRDAEQTYAGPGGTASVSCAMQLGETFITDDGSRRYRTEPEVDSGLKTIRATVTDGAGATAEASVDVYVILQIEGSGEILESGKTYRVHRFLVTVPEGLTLVIGGLEVNGSESVKLYTLGPRYRTWIWVDTFSGEACCRHFRHGYGHVRIDGTLWQTPEDEAAGVEPRRIEVPEEVKRFDALFDELVDSINRLPTVERAD